MRIIGPLAATFLSLAGCGGGDDDNVASAPANEGETAPLGNANEAPAEGSAVRAAGWELQSSGEGTALALLSAGGGTAIRLFCASGQQRLLVNVPGFRPIASEERLSFGSGGQAMALVADTKGDAQRGGVSGTSEVPDDLPALINGPVSVSYGAQRSGPHSAPPTDAARAFVAACSDERAPAGRELPSTPSAGTSPCLMQGSERLRITPIRAIGTEPFWGAKIEGRCVTYSHPEDQAGTRVWTRYASGAGGGTWSGALGGQRFELRTRPQAGCSDGMSDKSYPIAVDLTVGGEQRTGCAEPL